MDGIFELLQHVSLFTFGSSVFNMESFLLLWLTQQMKKYIEKESDMRGDYNTYLRVSYV